MFKTAFKRHFYMGDNWGTIALTFNPQSFPIRFTDTVMLCSNVNVMHSI